MSADNVKQKKFIEKLYTEHYTPMMRFATSLLKDPFHAEVAVQETFLVALKKYDVLSAHPEQVKWLYSVLRRIIKDMLKKQNRINKHIISLDDCSQDGIQATDEIDLKILYQGIVPDDELEILERLYTRGETYKELADEKGVPLSTIGMKAKRSKEKFRSNYDK